MARLYKLSSRFFKSSNCSISLWLFVEEEELLEPELLFFPVVAESLELEALALESGLGAFFFSFGSRKKSSG